METIVPRATLGAFRSTLAIAPVDNPAVLPDGVRMAAKPMPNPWFFWGVFFACVAIPFSLHTDYLHRGFFQDDFGLQSLCDHFSIVRAVEVFDPHKIHFFYRPLLFIWFMIFGCYWPHSSLALHAGSLVVYGLTIFSLATLTYRLTRNLLAPLIVSCLFVLAPSLQEAIWWVCSASTLLASLFTLMTLHAWMSARETRKSRYFVLSYLLMMAALCSKEDAAALPLILIVFDIYLLNQSREEYSLRTLASRWLPIIVLTALYGYCDIVAYRSIAKPGLTTQLWHGLDWPVICSFVNRTVLFSVFHLPQFPSVDPRLMLVLSASCVLYTTRRNPLCLAAFVLAMLVALPVPVASGVHCNSERFSYMPELFGALFAGLLIYACLVSCKPIIRSLGFVAAVSALLNHVSVQIDPVVSLALLIGMGLIYLLCAYIQFKNRHLDRGAVFCLAAVLSIAQFWLIISECTDLWIVVVPLIVLSGTVYGISREKGAAGIVDGIATSLVVATNPPVLAFSLICASLPRSVSSTPVRALE